MNAILLGGVLAAGLALLWATVSRLVRRAGGACEPESGSACIGCGHDCSKAREAD